MYLLNLKNISILEQLQIEEALLRADQNNWCLINSGASPAIVMGISGKPQQLIDIKKVKRDNIPVIKRFSGGGTVYIDSKTVFVTFICNASEFSVPAQPKPILEWSKSIYCPLLPDFHLLENDYCLGENKCGGNAQYIQRGRWLHHTSFLWDYDPLKMDYLLLPQKQPKYRKERNHQEFLCSIRSYYPEKESFIQALQTRISTHLKGQLSSQALLKDILSKPHRKGTRLELI